ncbi:type I restriction enzyme HsdR N-terminal domain-containing protein [Desulfonema magnum]|uniref:Type I restriction enzyme R N-terminal domain-containing protein n=1 Tax=Desulfonema magnum TaxID=45655 RepID=A0A975BTX5_9BACT|nr:type I restriction enzyme HsdR N-terminal domain-containing protein [Desulfonema magnum]QTA91681.1 Type I restriction enzyme R N-terminal domain-containing protein [Desulfonema magnum]
MAGHHLILGKLADFITGETLDDTHDERYKQKLARLLVEDKGYSKNEIEPRCELLVKAGDLRAIVKVDFKITLLLSSRSQGETREKKETPRICMIVKYGPGSLVTRQRSALASSRLLASYNIPVVVVTNGQDAHIMDGESGKVISSGLESVPSRSRLIQLAENAHFDPISAKQAEMESRIVYVFEIDGSCPCDDTVCRLE